MKIKCLKLKCTCGVEGLAHAFCNNCNSVRYARVRHYLKQVNGKPTFLYHKLENLAEIEELPRARGLLGQVQHQNSGQAAIIVDQNSNISSPNQFSSIQLGWSSSLVRTLALRAKGRRFKSGSAHLESPFRREIYGFETIFCPINQRAPLSSGLTLKALLNTVLIGRINVQAMIFF